MQKSYSQTTASVQREWVLMDAQDKVLGRLATVIASKLIGKHRPTYTPHIDSGDYVVVINASSVAVTGNKEETKTYSRHSNFPGGHKSETLKKLRQRKPEEIITQAVYNMLPDNRLRDKRMARLKVYAGNEHPHEGQITNNKSQ